MVCTHLTTFFVSVSLQNFIADDDESEAESTGSESDDSDASAADSDVPLSKKKKPARKQPTTRKAVEKAGAKDSLVSGLDEAKREELAEDRGWWCQFLEQPAGTGDANGAVANGSSSKNGGGPKPPTDDQLLQRIELGSKMILLMEILKECEMLGDKVLVFSQSLLSLDLIEEFLRVSKF